MNRNELKNLTRQLRELPPIPIPVGLEDRLVADLPVRRSRWRFVATFGGLAAAAAIAVAVFVPRKESRVYEDRVDVAVDVAQMRSEIAEARAEIERSFAAADRIEARERKAKAEFEIRRFESTVALERELAATILLMQGDWRRARGENGDAEYRQAIALFADTSAAVKAKLRLM